ncbi:hypothetical protein CFC21_042323 [Triticum aestivum]|uniref:EF-hand domain-containing protein n=2 Tax=Triticum aestivum TaxID=4565 RepID=A0A9R1FLI3_WHEAT|nr:hypothetical protein CFC21_042323 [Triticum aestivum]
MASMEVAKPGSSKRLSPKGSFRLSLLACGQCKATTVSPPGSPTGAGARSLSSSASSSAGTSRSRGRERDRQAELREIFRHFDRDMDGRISGRELGEFFASMGDGGAKAAMELDAASSGGAEGRGGGGARGPARAFEAFEAVKGSGRITPRGLQRVLSQLGDDPSVAECEAMIRAYDDDGDGELDFHDFHRMMSHD